MGYVAGGAGTLGGWRWVYVGAGAGGLVGGVGYMGWRYGMKGGQWGDAAVAVAEELNPTMPVEDERAIKK